MANKTVKPSNLKLQSSGSKTLYLTWTFSESHVDHYLVRWFYATGVGTWFRVSDSDKQVTAKQDTCTIQDNWTKVKVVVKPVSKKHTVNKKEVSYWTGGWCTERTYDVDKKLPPDTPSSAPSVEIDGLKLTVSVDNLDIEYNDGGSVVFYILNKTNNKKFKETGKIKVSHRSASYSCSVDAGKEYCVCYKIYNKAGVASGWSPYSGESGTRPGAISSGITLLEALSSTSVKVQWNATATADSYKVEYTTKQNYFYTSSSNVSSVTVDAISTTAVITGLESGQEYFFRVCAINEYGESTWTEVKSIKLGKKPAAPTTWSSTTTVMVGEPLKFYWVHNTEDGSSQVEAVLEIDINGQTKTETIKNSTDEDEKDKTSVYTFDTTSYTEGTTIKWRVKTCGVTGEYGDWSVQRTVDVYAPPVLSLYITDKNGTEIEELKSFPFYIRGTAGPSTQKPIGYHVTVSATEAYETVDSIGNRQYISKDETVYSKYFDVNTSLNVEMSAQNIDLENNITYKVSLTVAMNSGLTADDNADFKVAWEDQDYDPDLEIGIDEETLSAYLHPYCMYNGELASDVTMSVYRREYDGEFTEIATGLDNTRHTFVTDPHPALDLARYRVVAISKSTGAVSFYDPPGYPVGEGAIIIQWDEDWSEFEVEADEILDEPTWTGSILKLPYNIDVSDTNKPDVDLIEYIGRKHPVGYYGTQLGTTATWNVDIDKEDVDTIYALRRLMNYMGNVYVREPSGSGYWANIKVSMNRKHDSLIIPVTLTITRVEGGM